MLVHELILQITSKNAWACCPIACVLCWKISTLGLMRANGEEIHPANELGKTSDPTYCICVSWSVKSIRYTVLKLIRQPSVLIPAATVEVSHRNYSLATWRHNLHLLQSLRRLQRGRLQSDQQISTQQQVTLCFSLWPGLVLNTCPRTVCLIHHPSPGMCAEEAEAKAL